MTRKRTVSAAFGAAAANYDAAAEAQRRAAERLAERVRTLPLAPEPRVLEVGCGTGLLTRLLMPTIGGRWMVTDLAPAMVEAARAAVADSRAVFRVMDGEHPDAAGPFDLIVSNLAAQWFDDAPAALARLAGLLAPGGRLAVTTLGPDSFAEWRRAHEALGLSCGVPDYPSALEWWARLPAATLLAEPVTVRYADGRAFLRALKAIGAATPAPGHRPLAPGALKRVLDTLGAPAEMTYEVLTVIMEA